MKKLLLLLLLFPSLVIAQRIEWDIAFSKNIPDSLTKPIHMPERDYNPGLGYDNGNEVSYRTKERVVIISSDSLYRQFFWRYKYTDDSLKAHNATGDGYWYYKWMEKHHIDSLPVIDFSKNELVMYAACAQCLAFCHHNEGKTSCHRNACMFREAWFIKERKQVAGKQGK
jgi:hypothetical protein